MVKGGRSQVFGTVIAHFGKNLEVAELCPCPRQKNNDNPLDIVLVI